ncbi:MAG: histidine ammonia-lyase [Bacteroidota bacterium]
MFQYGKDRLTSGIALQLLRGEVKGAISRDSIQKIEECHKQVQSIALGELAVYGINTGFGPLCNTKIDAKETEDLQRSLLISHSVGVGNPISKELSKLMLILKVHSLCKGFSGISMEIIQRLLWHFEEDIIPLVPEQGSVGASGDLAPLSHLFLPLIGEGKVYYQGKVQNADQVLRSKNLQPVKLHPKAGLALINGTQFILAHAVLVVDKLHNCLTHADAIAAMMIEGLKASPMPFHDSLHEIRPHSGNMHVANKIYSMLRGSEIVASHKHCDRVQDPYSLRCAPQVHGSSRSAWLHLKEAVEIELNSVTDNPIVFSEDFTISGGNFHGQPLALPIDYSCLAAAELGSISDRRTYLALDGKYDIPKLLMENTGVNSGFMICQYTSAALVSENKGMCFPSSADSIPTSMGQEDHVSMGSIGGRKALSVVENLEKILAVELLCAAQAIDFRRPLRSTDILEAIQSAVREKVSFATKDRIFSKDIQLLTDLIRSRKLTEIIDAHTDQTEVDNTTFETY